MQELGVEVLFPAVSCTVLLNSHRPWLPTEDLYKVKLAQILAERGLNSQSLTLYHENIGRWELL